MIPLKYNNHFSAPQLLYSNIFTNFDNKLRGIEKNQKDLQTKFLDDYKKAIEEKKDQEIAAVLKEKELEQQKAKAYEEEKKQLLGMKNYGARMMNMMNPDVFADMYYNRYQHDNEFNKEIDQIGKQIGNIDKKMNFFNEDVQNQMINLKGQHNLANQQEMNKQKQDMIDYYNQPNFQIPPPPDSTQFNQIINTMPLFSNNPNQQPQHQQPENQDFGYFQGKKKEKEDTDRINNDLLTRQAHLQSNEISGQYKDMISQLSSKIHDIDGKQQERADNHKKELRNQKSEFQKQLLESQQKQQQQFQQSIAQLHYVQQRQLLQQKQQGLLPGSQSQPNLNQAQVPQNQADKPKYMVVNKDGGHQMMTKQEYEEYKDAKAKAKEAKKTRRENARNGNRDNRDERAGGKKRNIMYPNDYFNDKPKSVKEQQNQQQVFPPHLYPHLYPDMFPQQFPHVYGSAKPIPERQAPPEHEDETMTKAKSKKNKTKSSKDKNLVKKVPKRPIEQLMKLWRNKVKLVKNCIGLNSTLRAIVTDKVQYMKNWYSSNLSVINDKIYHFQSVTTMDSITEIISFQKNFNFVKIEKVEHGDPTQKHAMQDSVHFVMKILDQLTETGNDPEEGWEAIENLNECFCYWTKRYPVFPDNMLTKAEIGRFEFTKFGTCKNLKGSSSFSEKFQYGAHILKILITGIMKFAFKKNLKITSNETNQGNLKLVASILYELLMNDVRKKLPVLSNSNELLYADLEDDYKILVVENSPYRWHNCSDSDGRNKYSQGETLEFIIGLHSEPKLQMQIESEHWPKLLLKMNQFLDTIGKGVEEFYKDQQMAKLIQELKNKQTTINLMENIDPNYVEFQKRYRNQICMKYEISADEIDPNDTRLTNDLTQTYSNKQSKDTLKSRPRGGKGTESGMSSKNDISSFSKNQTSNSEKRNSKIKKRDSKMDVPSDKRNSKIKKRDSKMNVPSDKRISQIKQENNDDLASIPESDDDSYYSSEQSNFS